MAGDSRNRPGEGGGSEGTSGRGGHPKRTSGEPLGVALAMATDRKREAAGERSWLRTAYPGEWPAELLDGPPWAPAGFEVILHMQVDVVAEGVRTRRPTWLVAPAEAVTS